MTFHWLSSKSVNFSNFPSGCFSRLGEGDLFLVLGTAGDNDAGDSPQQKIREEEKVFEKQNEQFEIVGKKPTIYFFPSPFFGIS